MKSKLISNKTIELLVYRIQQEEVSSRLYRQMASWLEDKGYVNFSKLYKTYSEEELEHSTWAEKYLLSFGVKPKLLSLEEPTCEFKDLMDIAKQTLSHEELVTMQCRELAKHALTEGDFNLLALANKYNEEQIEEIEKAITLIDILTTFGTEGCTLLTLDANLDKYIS